MQIDAPLIYYGLFYHVFLWCKFKLFFSLYIELCSYQFMFRLVHLIHHFNGIKKINYRLKICPFKIFVDSLYCFSERLCQFTLLPQCINYAGFHKLFQHCQDFFFKPCQSILNPISQGSEGPLWPANGKCFGRELEEGYQREQRMK